MTKQLEDLRGELRRLSQIYLPLAPALVPLYEDQERARAFVIFCHAEIEWYIESVAEAYLVSVCAAAKSGVFNFSSLSLIASSEEKLSISDALGGKKYAKTLTTVFGKIEANLKSAIAGNNGIREKSLSKILGPLGLAGKIDAAWLGDLESLSSMRGRFAHMSGGAGSAAIGSINPEDIRKLCGRIVEGSGGVAAPLIDSLRSLDEALELWKVDFRPVVSVRRNFRERILRRLGLMA